MIDYDPFSPEALHDPLPLYRRLRYEAPCYFIASRNTWAISRFEDVWREFAQTDCYTSALGTLSTQVMSDRQRPLPPTLHCADAPQHTALWRALAKHMGAIALRGHEVHIQGVVDELVDAAYERGRFDMIDDVAWPLAVKVLALVCGFPIEDAALLHEFTRRYQTREPGLIGPNPDHFDIYRRAPRTVAFGTGPHACIGGALARSEGELLLRAVLKRMPEYVIDDRNLEVIETELVRGWKTLPVSVS